MFWIAAEDHDFAEVAKAEFISRDCQLESVEITSAIHRDGQPVGQVVTDESIQSVVDALFELLPHSEFSDDMKALVLKAWQPGKGFVDSFATMMTSLLGSHGLIFLDPLDADLKKLAAPIYSAAARQASDIALAIEERSRELEEAGYHAQVMATANSFPLFLHDETGARHAVTRTESGKYRAKEGATEYTAEELANLHSTILKDLVPT